MATETKIRKWTDLPNIDAVGGAMKRAGFRQDGSLVTFNYINPTMKRWEPHHHPFDQIVLTIQGTQILEVEGKAFRCPERSIARIAADKKHTGWPEGDKTVINMDIFSPARPDYLFLTDWQEGFPPRDKNAKVPAYHQNPTQKEFTGEWLTDTRGLVYRWEDLPTEPVGDGRWKRSGFRGDDCLVMFNWLQPGIPRPEPHSHPFDQIVTIIEGSIMLEVDGVAHEMGPHTICRIPPNAPHTGWPLGDKPVLNVDVFSPPRKDYLHLTKYQKEFAA